jgi:hypothetical protein
MFNFLTQIFSKKKEKNKIDNKNIEKKDYLCSLNIELNYDNSINILCYWPNLKDLDEDIIDDIANPYAVLLYMLNGGLLNQDIIKSLSNFENNNLEDSYFVNKVLSKWLELASPKIESKKHNTDPVIKPSSVFKNYSK